MIHKCGDKLGLLLNTDYRSILQGLKHQHLVYTGMVDAYFDYKLGRLPYRSLRFEGIGYWEAWTLATLLTGKLSRYFGTLHADR